MSRNKPVFKRARRCRIAYRWVRRFGYLSMVLGASLFLLGKTRTTGPELDPLQKIGFLLFILTFCIFFASYGLYFSIRMIESQPVEPADD